VAHAGNFALRLLTDRSGLTKELPKATARVFLPVQDRVGVLVEVGDAHPSRCGDRDIKRAAPPGAGAGAGGIGDDGRGALNDQT
jgi:hypothetical protein